MSDTNRVRDQLIAVVPQHADTIMERDRVVEQWCRENGKDKDSLTFEDLMTIRALPEWQNAGKSV